MVDSFILIFVGAAILASLAMFVRQPLIVVYMLLGVIFGPSVLGFVSDTSLVSDVSEIGILFLLFIVGLELPPSKLKAVFSTSMLTTLVSCSTFALIGFGVGWLFGFSLVECAVTGAAVMFSSTVLGIKLLPRTILHHRTTGDLVIGVLLIQDLIAVLVLVSLYLFLRTGETGDVNFALLLGAGPILLVVAFLGPKYIVWPLLERFDVFTEYIFVLYIGWCLALAAIAHACGWGFEIGAFIAGVALANSQVSQSVAETLEPLRDFFLVLFFFAVGARVDIALVPNAILPALLLVGLLLAVKPVVFRLLLTRGRVRKPLAWEVGIRLGQCSEFSLLVLFVAAPLVSSQTDHVILLTTILTMLVSTYLVVLNFKNPLAISERLRVQ